MSRIAAVKKETATPKVQEIFTNVEKAMGKVPNLVATLAQSPAAAQAYLGFAGALAHGSLPAKLRESIALAVGEANSCDYCLSAHSVLGSMAGLNAESVLQARRGTSSDPKNAAALSFVRKLVKDRGIVSDEDVASLRQHGFTEGEIVEIISHTALNIFTNYFNHVAGTEIDFPLAEKLAA